MKSFLEEVADKISKECKDWLSLVCIVPSERAGVRLKAFLKQRMSKGGGFLPRILSIEKFIKEIAQLEAIDNIALLFEFYKVYKESTEKEHQDSFEVFLSWATVVIQDFNEIDRHLVDADAIFSYINDIKRIETWDVSAEDIKKSKTLTNYLRFTELLSTYYVSLQKLLKTQGVGYQGLIYREAQKQVINYLESHKNTYCFIGFNALNKAEESIFQLFLESDRAKVFWDSDAYYMEANHEAGLFLRGYKNNWKYYEKEPFDTVNNNFIKQKQIEIIGAPFDVTQIKSVTEIVKDQTSLSNTAIVLSEESLLPVLLNSIPSSAGEVNITMGYSLKNTPLTSLFTTVFHLTLNKYRYQKSAFHYKDVLSLLRHPYIVEATKGKSQEIVTYIFSKNLIFIEGAELEKQEVLKEFSDVLNLFTTVSSIQQFIDGALGLISFLMLEAEDLKQMYLEGMQKVFHQLSNLNSEYQFIDSLKVLLNVFQKIINNEAISFQGDALDGLQLMGVLETRCLDFENVILTSVNEGILPSGTTEKSFIPFDIKKQFQIPTYLHKDAIFSYHFYRLLQRAKNIFLLYNTQGNDFGGGEKSRFLTQLEVYRNDVVEKQVVSSMSQNEQETEQIPKTAEILQKIKAYFSYGLSPTKLSTYVLDPLEFYKSVVLKIKQTSKVEEEVAFNTLGSVVHDTLDELHQPFVGLELKKMDVENMLKSVPLLNKKYFKIHYKDGEINFGKNKLISEVAIQFSKRFLLHQLELLNEGKQIRIIDLEKEYEASFITPAGNSFTLKGRLDRVDELDGVRRIVDYKTGLVKASDLKLYGFEKLKEDYKYSKALQVMIYALMYKQSTKFESDFMGGIYSFRNFREGFLPVNFSIKRGVNDYEITNEKLAEFQKVLFEMIDEILDLEIPFVENLENPYKIEM